jgi:hypothetical protein
MLSSRRGSLRRDYIYSPGAQCVSDICTRVLVSWNDSDSVEVDHLEIGDLPPGLRGLRTPLITGGSIAWNSTATVELLFDLIPCMEFLNQRRNIMMR